MPSLLGQCTAARASRGRLQVHTNIDASLQQHSTKQLSMREGHTMDCHHYSPLGQGLKATVPGVEVQKSQPDLALCVTLKSLADLQRKSVAFCLATRKAPQAGVG